MSVIFKPSPVMIDTPMHYCPGCSHGIVHQIVAEVIDELGIQSKCAGVAPIGCAVFAVNYWDVDMYEALHGRAPACATGYKRVHPENIVFTYQGDGDLASIGTAEIVQAAHRGEKITTIFINNAIYGMTGGQMAPTTLIGQKATTCPSGRSKEHSGSPIRMSELLATIDGSAYIARTSTHNVANVRKTKEAIKKAFQCQIDGKGFAMVEVLSTCSTHWGKSVQESNKWLEENMIPYYPLGVFKEV